MIGRQALIADLFREFCNLPYTLRNESHDDNEIRGGFEDWVWELFDSFLGESGGGSELSDLFDFFTEQNPELTDEDEIREGFEDFVSQGLNDFYPEGEYAIFYHKAQQV